MDSADNCLTMFAGKPFSQIIRVPDAKLMWPNLEDFEVRAQLRTGKSIKDLLISNLHLFMTWDFDDNDLVITWAMPGEKTRELYNKRWGYFKTGYFNVVVSDIGVVDAKALVVPTVTLTIKDITTTAVGV